MGVKSSGGQGTQGAVTPKEEKKKKDPTKRCTVNKAQKNMV
jgi:hypothetical protein